MIQKSLLQFTMFPGSSGGAPFRIRNSYRRDRAKPERLLIWISLEFVDDLTRWQKKPCVLRDGAVPETEGFQEGVDGLRAAEEFWMEVFTPRESLGS